MKKLFFLASALFLFSGLSTQVQAQSTTSSSSYWDFYRNYYSNNDRLSSTGSRYYTPRYRTGSSRSYRSSRSSTTSSRVSNRRTSSGYRVYSTNRSNSNVSTSAVKAIVTPITLRQDINNITSAPVDIFEIGLNYQGGSSSVFTPAAQVRQMQFNIQDNTGVVSDFSDFDLVIEDQSFQFERNGYITLNFNNLRLAQGESRGLRVQIRLNDPDSFARLPGSFRVKMSGMTAAQEGTVTGIKTSVTGRTVSDYVVLNPVGSVSGGGSNGSASSTPVFIAGRALGAGEKAIVLSARLEASRDDFLIEKVTVRNVFGNNVDALVQEVRLINQNTGQILSTKRFTGGVATFDLNRQNQVFIGRNNEVALAFEVLVRDNLPNNVTDNRLELTFNPADIEIFGVGAGQNVPDSSKSFNVDAQTFTVNQGGGSSGSSIGGISFSATQPSFVTNGNLDQIVRFQIRNGGSKGMSIGRLTIQAFPSGVEYVGGISTDDARLMRVVGLNEYSVGFNTTSASNNTFVFDNASEFYLGAGEVAEMALKLKLENIGSNDDSDSVAFKILGDSSFLSATTLAGQRSNGANFIWSDHSGSPHTLTSTDWLSGYLVGGLPTSNFIRYRR